MQAVRCGEEDSWRTNDLTSPQSEERLAMAQRIAAAELNVGTCPPCRRPQRRIGSEGVPAGEEARGGEEDEGRKMEDFSTVKKNGHGDHLIGPKKKRPRASFPKPILRLRPSAAPSNTHAPWTRSPRLLRRSSAKFYPVRSLSHATHHGDRREAGSRR